MARHFPLILAWAVAVFLVLPMAIIVDIDETMLDNSPYQARLIRDRKSFDDFSWNEWVQERAARPMPGALEFARAAAARDNLLLAPAADNQCPTDGHLVALVVAPGFDFHWYRKGRDGLWTHKPGPNMVTHLDNAGQPITDPRTANRGPYTSFSGFMVVRHGHIKLQ